jgi:hypothetical protein
MPDSIAANADNVQASWVDSSNQQFAVTFNSGITMMLKPSDYDDAAVDLATAAGQINAKVDVVDLGSGKALVIEADTDSTDGENPAWVEFVVAGLDVNIYSEVVGTDTLLDVAKSIKGKPSA